jgi:hypothetical protein
MNYVSIIGLSPYVFGSLYYNSYGMLIIATNGIIYHSYPHNKYLYFIDVTTNAGLFIISIYKYNFVIKYAIFALSVFLLNNNIIKHNKLMCEIIHVIFVQWVGLYAILDVYNHDKCYPLLFYC